MSQDVTLPDVLPYKASRPVPLDVVQPFPASLQTAVRPVKLDPPEMNGTFFKTDMIRPTCIGEVLNGQERNQHIVTLNADIAFVVRQKEGGESRSSIIRPDGCHLRTFGDITSNVGGYFFDVR